jgi:hypothetical protein
VHDAHKGKKGNACRLLVGKPEGKISFGIQGTEGRIILKWILQEMGLDGIENNDFTCKMLDFCLA